MKGETCKYPYKAEPPCDFNPRTHEGCDVAKAMHFEEDRQFQSTHP